MYPIEFQFFNKIVFTYALYTGQYALQHRKPGLIPLVSFKNKVPISVTENNLL